MKKERLEKKLQQVLGQEEHPKRLPETIRQCIQITREQQALQEEARTGFWQYLSDVFRFEGVGILGLHAAVLLLACTVIQATVDILSIPAFIPLFVLAVMPILFRSQYYGVSELEAVTRASGAQVILARLILAGAANLVCITILLGMGVSIQQSYHRIGQLVLYCLVPYLVCMSAMLRIIRLSKKNRVTAMAVFGICWGGLTNVRLNPGIYETSAMGFWIVAFLFFSFFFIREIYYIIDMRREGKQYGIIN